jgi:hypothetical protein
MELEEEKIKEIHEAMAASAGSVAAAAVLLRWPRKKLQEALSSKAELSKRWMACAKDVNADQTGAKMMADSDAANRPNTPPEGGEVVLVSNNGDDSIDDQEQAMIRAMQEENRQFGETLHALGWDEDTVNVARQLQGITNAHFKSGLELMHGGLQHTFLSNIKETNQVQPLFEQAAKALEDEDKYPVGSPERAAVIRELERLHTILSYIKESTVKVNTVIHKSALVQAIIKQNSKKNKTGKKLKRL